MKINLHIERLVLDGLPIERNQRSIVQAAVEAELTRLLSTDGIGASLISGGAIPYLAAGGIQLERDNTPAELGQQIAQSVYGGINR